ncbi:MAG: 50S ribosomal protein L17 [Candidatus Omnitrophota bacterium]|nr:MAG: 50S ribosomal protein L17 [Candidatus Omnitrophota bacterium]
MRHGKLNKRFGRNKSARKELIRSLARNALIYSRIKTTLPKAKEASRLLDKLISLGKKETLQARRAAFDMLQDRSLVSRLVKDIAPLFKDRNGGYTRIIQLNSRHGDGTQMAILELVEKLKEEPKPKKKVKAKAKEAPKKVVEAPREEPKPIEEIKEKPAPKKLKAKPKAKPPKAKEEPQEAEKVKPKPEKKKEWFNRIKGIFKRKKD